MKYVKSILISVFISALICLGIMQVPDSCINECQGEQITALNNEQHIYQVIHYEVIDNQYVINGKDPQIIFRNFEHPIASIYVEMSDVATETALFELYISKPGEVLTEEDSIKKLAKVQDGKVKLSFDVPLDYYGEIRMDMNADFTLDKFEVGDRQLKCYSNRSFPFVIFLMLVLIFETVWLVYDCLKRKDKITTKQFICNCFVFAGSFVLFFIVQYFNVHVPFFGSDEGDNFAGGKMITLGADVYSGFTSQHMPLMYYICSIFALFGAQTVFEYRIGFYIFMALLWTCMVFRYRKQYGLLTMVLYPVLYICAISANGENATTVLSEQVQAQGLVILMLEFLIYIKEKNIDTKVITWVSLAVFLSFGTAFVSAFAICPIVVYVLITEVRKSIVENKWNFKVFWKNIRGMLIGVLAPFLVLIFWYLLSGNLYNAYFGAYVINTEYYSKYYPVGGSILDTLTNPIDFFVSTVKTPMQLYYYVGLVSAIVLLGVLLFKKKIGCAVVIILCILWSGVRGFVGFHSLPYHGLTMLFAAIWLGVTAKSLQVKTDKQSSLRYVVPVLYSMVLLVLVFMLGKEHVWSNYNQLKIKKNDVVRSEMPFLNELICELTEPGEYAYFFTFDKELWLDTELLPAAPSPMCIWIYEAYQEDIIVKLEQNNPKVMYIPENIIIWGYKPMEFAQDVYKYVADNYDRIDVLNLYIRKEGTEKEREILWEYFQ